MRYYVQLDSTTNHEPVVVDVSEQPTGDLEVMAFGRRIPVDVSPHGTSPNILSIRVGGRVVDLKIEGSPPDLVVTGGGRRARVRVESERQRAASHAKKTSAGGGEKVVKAPMPGRVVRMLVAQGAEIALGQTLCVIEAMKMENEIKANA